MIKYKILKLNSQEQIKVVQNPASSTMLLSLQDICIILQHPELASDQDIQKLFPGGVSSLFSEDTESGGFALPAEKIKKLTEQVSRLDKKAKAPCFKISQGIQKLLTGKINLSEPKKQTRKPIGKHPVPAGDIRIYTNEVFGEVRSMTIDDRPMFVAIDVALALGYEHPQNAVSTHCQSGDDLNFSKIFVPHGNGVGGTNLILISESNVYRLIMSSKLPEAEKFKKWVFEKVLPSIHHTGGYIPVKEGETSADILAKALLIAKETIVERDRLIAQQGNLIEINKPKVEFYNDFIENRDWFKSSTIADELRTNPRVLHSFLSERKIIHRTPEGVWEANRAFRQYQVKVYYEYPNPQGTKMYKYGTRFCWTHTGREAILQLWKEYHT